MIIDVFCHHIPKSIGRLVAKAGFHESGQEKGFDWRAYPADNADAEARLKVMDKYHIDIQVMSQSTPLLMGSSPEAAAEICRLSNDGNYALCKAYPLRFINIGVVSLLDVRSAMYEADRCVQDLDARGIVVASNQNGIGLDSSEYYPLYERLVKNDLPLFIHPTNWESYPLVDIKTGLGAVNVIGWPFDTTQAVWRIIAGGVIDRFPNLKVVTHHCGAMVPFFAKRMEHTLTQCLPRPVSEYWDNIYGDTALGGSVAGCECGYAFFGSERMMFGSDYPFGGESSMKANLDSVMEMNIPEKDRERILGENAKKLLKID
jgi:predicted TIM-barrel fold metal-dependent hydrolase